MKNEFRDRYKIKRNKLHKSQIKDSAVAFKNIFACNFDVSSKNVMLYMPIRNEADPKIIMDYCIKKNCNVYLPCLEGRINIYPCRIRSFGDMSNGKFNIPEPALKEEIAPRELDMVIVPGLTFDLHGNRLGYGKGFYDTFLKELELIKIGLCYEFQIYNENLPCEEYDVRMDYILTEKKLYEVMHAL